MNPSQSSFAFTRLYPFDNATRFLVFFICCEADPAIATVASNAALSLRRGNRWKAYAENSRGIYYNELNIN